MSLLIYVLPRPKALDDVSVRVCLLDAIKLLCFVPRPWTQFTDATTFDRPDLQYLLENVMKTTKYPKMSWDEACTATRGLMEFMEHYEPSYHEEAFMIHRGGDIIGTGHIIYDVDPPPPTPSTLAGTERMSKRRGNTSTSEWNMHLDIAHNFPNHSCELDVPGTA